MSEEIDKSVFRKYEIQTKLGKGVSAIADQSVSLLLLPATS